MFFSMVGPSARQKKVDMSIIDGLTIGYLGAGL